MLTDAFKQESWFRFLTPSVFPGLLTKASVVAALQTCHKKWPNFSICGWQQLCQSCCLPHAGRSCIFCTDWPLTGNEQLIHQKPYITGTNLGHSKTCGTWAGKHSYHIPRRQNSAPQRWQRVSTCLITPQAHSGSRWKRYWQSSQVI